MNTSIAALRSGCEILDDLLVPHGFRFEFGDAGHSSGGEYAFGEYVRGERRLALHFRFSLGLVTYQLGSLQVTHAVLARAVFGGSGCNAYPGFSSDPLDGFRHLRQDLERFGAIFLRGGEEELRSLLIHATRQEAASAKGLRALP